MTFYGLRYGIDVAHNLRHLAQLLHAKSSDVFDVVFRSWRPAAETSEQMDSSLAEIPAFALLALTCSSPVLFPSIYRTPDRPS